MLKFKHVLRLINFDSFFFFAMDITGRKTENYAENKRINSRIHSASNLGAINLLLQHIKKIYILYIDTVWRIHDDRTKNAKNK